MPDDGDQRPLSRHSRRFPFRQSLSQQAFQPGYDAPGLGFFRWTLTLFHAGIDGLVNFLFEALQPTGAVFGLCPCKNPVYRYGYTVENFNTGLCKRIGIVWIMPFGNGLVL